MKIEFDKIVGNAASAIVIAIVMGAFAMVWKGATTVDSKIDAARQELTNQQAIISQNQQAIIEQHDKSDVMVKKLESELIEMKQQNNFIIETLNGTIASMKEMDVTNKANNNLIMEKIDKICNYQMFSLVPINVQVATNFVERIDIPDPIEIQDIPETNYISESLPKTPNTDKMIKAIE